MIALRWGSVARGFSTDSAPLSQMRHGIAVNALCRAPRFRQDRPMSGYQTIDPLVRGWAEARGLHVYTGHKQNDVRSITIYVWFGTRHESTGHIWIDPRNELGLVGVHAAAGSFRYDDAVPPERLLAALDGLSDRLTEHKLRTEACSDLDLSAHIERTRSGQRRARALVRTQKIAAARTRLKRAQVASCPGAWPRTASACNSSIPSPGLPARP